MATPAFHISTPPGEAKRDGSSFRDSRSVLFRRDGRAYRQINLAGRADYDHLIGSGLYGRLLEEGLLTPHEETPEPAFDPAQSYRVLLPQSVPFSSYAYEWCVSQIQAAALATLAAQRLAIEHGMSLRDARTVGVQFSQGRALLVDCSSFEKLRDNQPWPAYVDFCRNFLAPLALASCVDARLLMLQRVYLDGLPLDLTSQLLPVRSRLKPGLHMHVHSMTAGKKAARAKAPLTKSALLGLVDSLESAVHSLSWTPESAASRQLTAAALGGEAAERRNELIAELLQTDGGKMVWDLHAETGALSRMAARKGAFAVSMDADPAAVEINFQACRKDGAKSVLPLVADWTNPSSDLGWAGAERQSLAARGPADVVLALGLVRKLAGETRTPVQSIAECLAPLGKTLIVEHAPLGETGEAGRDAFESAFQRWFAIDRRETLTGTNRTVYLMRRTQ